uniref:LIM zinc-binding domain-containing protein n=1 Tax=Macrostomum lignano TaxID=282301 RepID=A0A1I8GP77_9PLAT
MATAPPTQPSPSAAAAAPSLPDAGGSAQRFPELLLKLRGHRNTDIRDGKCRIVYRSELDPRWTEPQVIDESVVIERNRLESLNLQRINPDVKERTHVKCICTRLLNLREDWYAHLYDGTIICNACARCFRCRTLCFTAAKKLNSIDGFVLCNTCMLSYGRYKEPKIKIRLQPLPKSLGDMETEAAKQQSTPVQESHMTTESIQANNANSSNGTGAAEGGGGVTIEVLTEPRFRKEGRRPLRQILYPDPRKPNHNRPDYRFEPPPYLAVDRNIGPQACPSCQQQALSQALVVPGIARVYHERAFQCAACQKPMHSGYQLPDVQFEGCSCPTKPMVWCTKVACRQARLLHHTEANCQLEPLHPGGRPKRDVPGILPRFDPKDLKKYHKERHAA